jgi:hypothetical protein
MIINRTPKIPNLLIHLKATIKKIVTDNKKLKMIKRNLKMAK